MYRTVFRTLWEKTRVGWFARIALKHVYYHMWNRSPFQVQCMRQGTQAWCMGWSWGMGWWGDGRGVQDEEHLYTHGWFMSMYGKKTLSSVQFSSVTQSCPTLRPHESQHTRPPCPSPTPAAYSNSCPLSQWCHPAISSSVVPSPAIPNPSQHHSLFQWVNSSHKVAKVLEFQL